MHVCMMESISQNLNIYLNLLGFFICPSQSFCIEFLISTFFEQLNN